MFELVGTTTFAYRPVDHAFISMELSGVVTPGAHRAKSIIAHLTEFAGNIKAPAIVGEGLTGLPYIILGYASFLDAEFQRESGVNFWPTQLWSQMASAPDGLIKKVMHLFY